MSAVMKGVRMFGILVIVCICLCAGTVTAHAAYGTCGNNLTYDIDEDGVLTISGTGDMWNGKHGSPVINYGIKDSVTSIVIQEGVTSVGDWAFWRCENVESVSLPDSLTKIGYAAFIDCFRLNEVNIPGNVKSVGDGAFELCSLSSVVIPDSVESIGKSAFNCSSLCEIFISANVKEIGDNAFANYYGDLVMYGELDSPAFEYATANNITFIDGAHNINNTELQITNQQQLVYEPGTEPVPEFDVTIGETTLAPETDYSVVSVDSPERAGSGSITIEGIGNYRGTKTFEYQVGPRDISKADIYFYHAKEPFDVVYTGVEMNPIQNVKEGRYFLSEEYDYDVELKDAVNVGTATVTVRGKGDYTGSFSWDFQIVQADVAGTWFATTSARPYTYTGKEIMPKVKTDAAFTEGIDYVIAGYQDNIEPGLAKIIIQGINNCKGEQILEFYIKKVSNPMIVKGKTAVVKYSAVKKKKVMIAAKSAVTVSKAQGKVTYKKASGNKKITVASTGKVTVGKGLKKGLYNVKVRVTAKGNDYYSALTKTVTFKIRVK